MKVTLEFNEPDEAKWAIHAGQAWTALRDIEQALRSHTKHDVSETRTIESVKEIVAEVSHLLYS
jgi:hypothetical protein